ncbi:MAG: hypothetical protein AAB654_23460, partial [Acidobacteriota bacterium]
QTGIGKTSLVKYLAGLAQYNFRRFNLNGQTDKTEFIGGYKPDEKGAFRSVRLAGHGEATYGYDAQGRLRDIRLPDGSRIQFQLAGASRTGQPRTVAIVRHPSSAVSSPVQVRRPAPVPLNLRQLPVLFPRPPGI